MKVLNFLILSGLDALSKLFIEYLVDAGHLVTVLSPDSNQAENWQDKPGFNYREVMSSNDLLDFSSFDCLIDFQGRGLSFEGLMLMLDSSWTDDGLWVGAVLLNESKAAYLVERTLPVYQKNMAPSYFQYYLSGFLDVLIDATILLSRSTQFDFRVFDRSHSNEILRQFLDYDRLFCALVNHYQSFQGKSPFRLQDLQVSVSQEKTMAYKALRVDLHSRFPGFSECDLELLALYLMALFNGRKGGLYAYDIKLSGKNLVKWVELGLSDTCQGIQVNLMKDVYDIIHHPCFEGYNEFEPEVLPQVQLLYDASESQIDSALRAQNNAILMMAYGQQTGVLEISYQNPFIFFEALSEHIENFLNQLALFRQGELTFRDFLKPSADYLRACLHDGNETSCDFSLEKTLHGLFEEKVAECPNHLAVSSGESSLTYAKLNEDANQLAHYLLSIKELHWSNAKPLIALHLDRTEHMIVSLLAVLKTGAAYLPLDVNYPEERIRFILEDSGALCLISDAVYQPKLSVFSEVVQLVMVDQRDGAWPLENPSQCVPSLQYAMEDIAYVIYTSGTTGHPKGVVIEQKSLVNLLLFMQQKTGFTDADRLLAVTTLAFDIAALEIFMPLMSGGHLVLAGASDVLAIQKLLSLMEAFNVTFLQATPSLWSLISQEVGDRRLPVKALCGGENLPLSLAKWFRSAVLQCWNVYGPTETTIWSTITHTPLQEEVVNIGYPISNTTCYIMDDDGIPLPRGVVGELWIGGVGVARGYLNRPALTAEKFVQHPFQRLLGKAREPYARLFRTGDLARRLGYGEIECLGRNDFQIKLRGHRIELGEIESILEMVPGVKRALVLMKTLEYQTGDFAGNQYLVAYYVSDTALEEKVLFDFLRQRLPEYMIPQVWVHLVAFPLNVNGKIDRKALPEISERSFKAGGAPSNPLEEKLSLIWSEILRFPYEQANIYDDFFSLGGNSILAIRLMNRINAELKIDIKIIDLFNERTIQKLACLIQNRSGRFIYEDYQIAYSDQEALFLPFPLNNVQQSYYLGRLNQFALSHVSTHVYSEYRYQTLDVPRLEAAFNCLLKRHLSLRTIFVEGKQVYLKHVPEYKIRLYPLSSEPATLAVRQQLSHKLYSPDVYPLFDLVVTQREDGFILHVSFDALLLDMSSFQILFSEWKHFYEKPGCALPELLVNYRDYVFQYEALRQSALFLEAKAYWQAKVEDYQFELNIPLAEKPSEVNYPKFLRIQRVIPASVWNILLSKAQSLNVSPTVLVLEVYGKILSYWSGQKRLCVNLTLFNRLPLHPHVDRIMGDFTVLELFDYQDATELSCAERLKKTHASLLKDIEHNLFDGVDFQRLVKEKKSLGAHNILSPVVLTSVLGTPDQSSLFDFNVDDSYQGVEYAISQTSQVWLDNKAYQTQEGFVAEWDYVEQLFEPALIKTMHDQYCDYFIALAELDWHREPFPDISLPEKDRFLIEKANAAIQPLPEETLFGRCDRFIHENGYFHGVAVEDVGVGKNYQYQQLLSESERLALYLYRHLGLGEGTQLIGILSEKGYNQVVSVLAIMRAGYAYLPLHNQWPSGRIIEILEQASAQGLMVSRAQLSHPAVQSFVQVRQGQVWVIEDLLDHARLASSEFNIAELPRVEPDAVAYVIFTSGSTGKPKGVTMSHRGALNTIDAVNRRFHVSSQDAVLALSDLSFDLSVYDIFGLLSVGGTLVFPNPAQLKNPRHWLDLVEQRKITLWNTVPQLANLLVDEKKEEDSSLCAIRVYLLSGDWIPVHLPEKLKRASPNAIVMSLGGATEGGIWSIWHEINAVLPGAVRIPYGTAMPNQAMYVLDEDLKHCPVGVVGGIYIGGHGVALNYWKAPELTKSQFIHHEKLGNIYKTGDLGRWHPDGYMEFMGRNDHQVKLNGYRIELEEIASKLKQLPGVEEAVVKIQSVEKRDYITAYLLPKHVQAKKRDSNSVTLLQKGILNDLSVAYRLNLVFDPSLYALRKSYRNFSREKTNISNIEALGQHLMQAVKNICHADAVFQGMLTDAILEGLMCCLSGVTLEHRPLPKYRYPSGGSTYSIRSFLTLSKEIGAYRPGCYYYHPTQYALCQAPLDLVAFFAQANDEETANRLDFVVYWPAILPLYGHDAVRLSAIEVGHIIALMVERLSCFGIGYQLRVQNRKIDEDSTLIASLILETKCIELPEPNLEFCSLPREALDIDLNNVFFKSSEFGALIENSHQILGWVGKDDIANYLLSGFIFQQLSERLYQEDIGSCSIGYAPSGFVYMMAVGKMLLEEKYQMESISKPPALREVIHAGLSDQLPEYMLPYVYSVLDQIPLTGNGKLDAGRLPDILIEKRHEKPETEAEFALSELWQAVLNSKIAPGVTDSFFEIGGNSLLAMQLVSRINQTLGCSLSLVDFYEKNTIRALAHEFGDIHSCVREEGII